MAKNNITVQIVGDAKSLNDALDSAGGRLQRFGGLAAGVGAAGVAAGAAAAVGLFRVGDSFNNAANIITQGTGATGEALDELRGNLNDVLSSGVTQTSDVVAGALADVNTLFALTGDELEEATRQSLEFARVTGGEVGAQIAGFDAILTQFGDSADDLGELQGDLLRISQASGAGIDQLLSQLETFGPLFANAGFEAEETAAIFGQLEQAGVDITRVGPALNKFFRDAAADGEEPRAALEGIVEQIANAESSTEALNLASEAFGAEGAQRLTNAIRTGNFDLEEFNGLLGDGAGIVSEQAEATKTLGDRWNEFKNRVLVQLEPVATAVFDAVEQALVAFGPLAEDGIAAVSGFVEAVRPTLEEIAGYVEENWPAVRDTLLEAFTAVQEWLDENWPPIEETVLAVLGEIRGWVEENWPTIQAIITETMTLIELVVTEVLTRVQLFWQQHGDKIVTAIQIAWDLISGIVSGALTVIQGVITTVTGLIEGDWDKVWEGIRTILDGVWQQMETIVDTALGVVQDLVSGGLDAVKGFFTDTWDSVVIEVGGLGGRITSAASGMWDGITQAFRGAINFIIDGWNSLSFSVPDVPGVPFLDGQTISTPDVARLATGGAVFRPTLAIVGDNPGAASGDPEIVAPQSFIREAVRDELDADAARAGIVIENMVVNDGRDLFAAFEFERAMAGVAA